MKKIRKHLKKHNHYDMHLIFTQIGISAVSLPLAYLGMSYLDSDSAKESLFIMIAVVYAISSLLLFTRILQVIFSAMHYLRITSTNILFIIASLLVFYLTYWMITFAGLLLLGFA